MIFDGMALICICIAHRSVSNCRFISFHSISLCLSVAHVCANVCVQYASIKFIYALIGKLAAGQSVERSYWIELMNSSISVSLSRFRSKMYCYEMDPTFVICVLSAHCVDIFGAFSKYEMYSVCNHSGDTHTFIQIAANETKQKNEKKKNVRIAIANHIHEFEVEIFEDVKLLYSLFAIWMMYLNVVALYVVVLHYTHWRSRFVVRSAHHATLFCCLSCIANQWTHELML